jgi:hypothetical protein
MTFKHYILTRFNIGLYSDNPYKIADPAAWMRERIRLFNQYCLPSIKSQTCQDFTWILAFDGLTKLSIFNEIELPDNAITCVTQPHLYLRECVKEADWIITSRFDNDDYYEPDFVEVVQKSFRFEREVIDIDYKVVDEKTGKFYTSNRWRANSPFLSLCEPWENIVTAMGHPHSEMPNYYPAEKLPGCHAVQVIHGGNVCNKIKGKEI